MFILAAGDFTLTNERLEVVEATIPLTRSQVQVIYSKTSTQGNLTGLLGVLSTNLWITIFGFMLIFFLLFVVTIKYSMPKSTIALAILDSAVLIVKAFLGQGFDEDVFCNSHYGLKKTFILQLQLLSLVGAMVFWIYSGCLISFFTFSPSAPPINFISDLEHSPMKFHLHNHSYFVYEIVIKVLGKAPKSIDVGPTFDIYKKVVLDIANGTKGISGISENFIWQKIIYESTYFKLLKTHQYSNPCQYTCLLFQIIWIVAFLDCTRYRNFQNLP